MNNISKISIIIPVYNDPNLKRCLASIAMQTFQDTEIIVIDDYSTKVDYSSIISSFESLLNLKYIKLNKNSGCGVARQTGLDNATSDYIMFCDSDDTFYSSIAIEELYAEMLQDNTTDALIGDFYEEHLYDKDNLTYRKLIKHSGDITWLFAKIYRRQFLLDNNIGFPDSSANEDLGFNSLCLACAGLDNIRFCDKEVYLWHSNPNSITRNKDGDFNFKGLLGFVQNHIWFYQECVKRNINTQLSLQQSVDGMIMMYVYYINISRNRNSEELNEYVSWVKNYFSSVWSKLPKEKYEVVCERYFTITEQNQQVFKLYIPNITVYQFVKLFE